MSTLKRRTAASGLAVAGMTFGLIWAPIVAGAAPATLWVAPSGTGGVGATNTSCSTAGFSTISAAVTAASTGALINVCPGTYQDTVTISTKAVTINGANGGTAVLDAINKTNGIAITDSLTSPKTTGTIIENLTIENAKREGVTISQATGINILNNVVTGNDQMCQPQLTSDDCGESVDLEAVTNSIVRGNTITKGTGGILISDGIPAGSIGQQAFGFTQPAGPTSGNVIDTNTVTDNVWDCGITMPSHNSLAVKPNGTPDPTAGGVFNNTIQNNTVTNNGISGGGGAGILMAGPFPGTGVYNNTIQGNIVSGNGQGGVVLHAHAPGEDLNGNKILNNTIGTNGVGETTPGVGVFTRASSLGDTGSGDPATTGIEIFAPAMPVTGTIISGNTISSNHYGIWILNNLSSAGVSNNTTKNVVVPLYLVPPVDSGYNIVASSGTLATYGQNTNWGDAAKFTSGSPVVGVAMTPDQGGYWIVTANGGVFAFGDAAFYGSTGGIKLNKPVVGIAATPDGHGYWLVASDGGVFSYGDAQFFGSAGNIKLNQPVVGLTGTPDGAGYWLVASDGGVFSYGDANFHGSAGNIRLNKPVVGIATTSTGQGYWLVASDGGIFSYGDARFHGSMGNVKLNQPVVGFTGTLDGGGYWLVASDGGVFSLGDAKFHGSAGGSKLGSPVVGIAEGEPFLAG